MNGDGYDVIVKEIDAAFQPIASLKDGEAGREFEHEDLGSTGRHAMISQTTGEQPPVTHPSIKGIVQKPGSNRPVQPENW